MARIAFGALELPPSILLRAAGSRIIVVVTTEVRDVTALPRVPAVYVMHGGSPRWAACVGIGGDLRERIAQHLIKRDSSIATFTSAVVLSALVSRAQRGRASWRNSQEGCCRTLEVDRPRDTR